MIAIYCNAVSYIEAPTVPLSGDHNIGNKIVVCGIADPVIDPQPETGTIFRDPGRILQIERGRGNGHS